MKIFVVFFFIMLCSFAYCQELNSNSVSGRGIETVAPNGELQDVNSLLRMMNLLEYKQNISNQKTLQSVLEKLNDLYPDELLVPVDIIPISKEDEKTISEWGEAYAELYMKYLQISVSSLLYWQGRFPEWEKAIRRPDDFREKEKDYIKYSVDPTFIITTSELSEKESQKIKNLVLKKFQEIKNLDESEKKRQLNQLYDAYIQDGDPDVRNMLGVHRMLYEQIVPVQRAVRYSKVFKGYKVDPEMILWEREKKAEEDNESRNAEEANGKKDHSSLRENDNEIEISSLHKQMVLSLCHFFSEKINSEDFSNSITRFSSFIDSQTPGSDLWIVMKGDELEMLEAVIPHLRGDRRNFFITERNKIIQEILDNRNGRVIPWLVVSGDIETLFEFRDLYEEIALGEPVKVFPYRRVFDQYEVVSRDPDIVWAQKKESLQFSDREMRIHKERIEKYAEARRDKAISRIWMKTDSTREGRIWFLENVQSSGPFANRVRQRTLMLDGVID